MEHKTWRMIAGDGEVYSGRCLVTDIILWPNDDGDYADVYDGRDTTSGRKFCRVESAVSTTMHFVFGSGIPFDVGIYVDGKDGDVQTTIGWFPL